MIDNFQNLPDGFISGAIIGVLAASFGFILTMVWDIYKSYKDKNDKTISIALRHEIESNINILRNNKELLNQELEAIKNQETVVNPLTPLHNQMWSAVILNMPNKLVRNPQLLESLRDATYALTTISETVASRENYRINNATNTGLQNKLKIYDGIILDQTQQTLESLETLVQEF